MKNREDEEQNIYIILSFTGAMLSRLIRLKTGDEYCHISIALDKDLNKMYSFGRLHPYNPFWGGFVHEKIESGTFKRFKKTKVEVYSLKVSKKQYRYIEKKIAKMENQKQIYSFNIVGLFATGFNIKYRKTNSFYCAEFVKYLIDEANVKLNLPELIKPSDFQSLGQMTLEYRGLLSKYRHKNK